jgi:hypothetical protein
MSILITNTLTLSQIAQRALNQRQIKSRIVKISKSSNGDCKYGIELDNNRLFEAKRILTSLNIEFTTEYIK